MGKIIGLNKVPKHRSLSIEQGIDLDLSISKMFTL